MDSFSCPLTLDVEGQTISIELHNNQLWCLQFDSSTTMGRFFHQINHQLSRYTSSHDINLGIPKHLMPKIQIVPYQITSEEEKNFYYQQRYHATENEEIMRVRDFIGPINGMVAGLLKEHILSSRLDDPITFLSTGEFKIVCLLKAFWVESKIIFIEELFAGLDAANRLLVIQFLQHLKQALQTCIIVATTRPCDKSHFDRYMEIKVVHQNENIPIQLEFLNGLFTESSHKNFHCAFRLSNVRVKYNDRVILNNISWTVRKQEKWALHGKNGSGKSTLLSLINADHPQSYANDITLFDQSRKYGQSIWEIKENIAFFSHEFFRFFDKSKTLLETIFAIANGNPYKQIINQGVILERLNFLMRYFDLPGRLLNRPLNQLSHFQQRLIILLGVLLKESPLLILDEPYHFFDPVTIEKCNFLLDTCLNHRTLVFVSHMEADFPSCIEHHFYLS